MFTNFSLNQAGLTSLEKEFSDWQFEEELKKFTLEEVGLG